MWEPRARAPLPCLWGSPKAVAIGVSIGINYGKIADNLPSPSRVSWLFQPMQVAKVKLYDAYHSILTVFHGSSIELIIGVGNEKLSAMIDMTSDSKINKTPNKMAITSRIRKRITISRTKLNIKLHRSINYALIPKSSTSKKILNVLFLRDRKAIRSGGNLNAKKIAKRTKISHKKLITKTSLDEGNILRIITSNDHIINIEKKKSTSTRRSVNEK
ncbi:hypothetical protein QYE76_040697 [Lolium multiflorum]|uniref:Uncharacterized protein n=1 Tax=Lolium multiflorum TaxID=4521 RepID=A0AAD8WTF6_LOLMU|nr:hypothetical protein QYE76_040697 [Lolium multiflorum]